MKIEETANCCLYPSTRGNAEVLSANLSSSKSRQSADHIVIVIHPLIVATGIGFPRNHALS